MEEKTLGEQRVRVDFNVNNDEVVGELKTRVAELINLVDGLKDKDPRLAAIASTSFEEAGMWAVKLATA